MKKRIIPSILLKGGTQVFLSQKFEPWRTVGALVQNLRLHINREADELLIINLEQAEKKSFLLPSRMLHLIRQEVDIPISYCGAVRSKENAAECINSGFDKVFITSAFFEDNNVLKEISSLIGSQSVGVTIPYKYSRDNQIKIWDFHTKKFLNKDFEVVIRNAIKLGAGEILLFNIDRDGTMKGLDIDIYKKLNNLELTVPILIAGGASSPDDFAQALSNDNIQGIVGGSIFSLSQYTPKTIRSFCEKKGINMRRCISGENL